MSEQIQETGENAAAGAGTSVHGDIVRLSDYLFEVTYDSYEAAEGMAREYFGKRYKLGACSSVQNGMIRGRNYDWYYDRTSTFVVHVPAAPGRHASVGVAVGQVTPEQVLSGEPHLMYDILPFITLDGMNDQGLVMNVNVIQFGELGSFVMRTEDPSDDMFPLMACRLVLDKAATVQEALELMETMDFYSILNLDEAHFMISGKASAADPTYKTVVVELVPDEQHHYQLNVIEDFVDQKPIMTNFPLTGFDGTEGSLSPHPIGIERYWALSRDFGLGETVPGMLDLMKRAYYTRSYDPYVTPFWYSAHIGPGDGPKYTERGEDDLRGDLAKAGPFQDVVRQNIQKYRTRSRKDRFATWHTVHTSVYDAEALELSLMSQEGSIVYRFDLAGQLED
ncbi:MAG: carcinine hydrolase/isopenicillin-N N-acyltransferase family protein [Coriobacteriia bacterium]|nr:carcinine hydrolase/isopenicillin-N N-acyltransferase family protein [Coriobacteriia bacterium]